MLIELFRKCKWIKKIGDKIIVSIWKHHVVNGFLATVPYSTVGNVVAGHYRWLFSLPAPHGGPLRRPAPALLLQHSMLATATKVRGHITPQIH